jgi:formimidoylglutamate deiminase
VDSFAQVDLLEDARALELQLRTERLERAVLDPGGGPADARLDRLAARLLEAATAGGMASLGWEGGRLAPGAPADFAVLDLDDPSIAGAGPDDLLPVAVFAGARSAFRDLYVAGEPVILGRDAAPGRPAAAALARGFREALAVLRRP